MGFLTIRGKTKDIMKNILKYPISVKPSKHKHRGVRFITFNTKSVTQMSERNKMYLLHYIKLY